MALASPRLERVRYAVAVAFVRTHLEAPGLALAPTLVTSLAFKCFPPLVGYLIFSECSPHTIGRHISRWPGTAYLLLRSSEMTLCILVWAFFFFHASLYLPYAMQPRVPGCVVSRRRRSIRPVVVSEILEGVYIYIYADQVVGVLWRIKGVVGDPRFDFRGEQPRLSRHVRPSASV